MFKQSCHPTSANAPDLVESARFLFTLFPVEGLRFADAKTLLLLVKPLIEKLLMVRELKVHL